MSIRFNVFSCRAINNVITLGFRVDGKDSIINFNSFKNYNDEVWPSRYYEVIYS